MLDNNSTVSSPKNPYKHNVTFLVVVVEVGIHTAVHLPFYQKFLVNFRQFLFKKPKYNMKKHKHLLSSNML